MLFRSKAPPPFSSFSKPRDVLSEGPAGTALKKISDGSVEERKDGLASVALMAETGKIEEKEAVEIFGRALRDENQQVRNLAFLNLARMGSAGLDGLFCGLDGRDAAVKKMCLDMISSILSSDPNALRCGNLDVRDVRVKVGMLLDLLGEHEDRIDVTATSCLREIAARSPVISLEETIRRKGLAEKGSEEFLRLGYVENSAMESLARDAKESGC